MAPPCGCVATSDADLCGPAHQLLRMLHRSHSLRYIKLIIPYPDHHGPCNTWSQNKQSHNIPPCFCVGVCEVLLLGKRAYITYTFTWMFRTKPFWLKSAALSWNHMSNYKANLRHHSWMFRTQVYSYKMHWNAINQLPVRLVPGFEMTTCKAWHRCKAWLTSRGKEVTNW